MLVIGCIHGNACAGMAVARELAVGHPRLDLWLLPNLDPDGSARGTSLNGRGVDLDRNWGVGWRAGGIPGQAQYPGPAPFSERETRLARGLILRLRPQLTIWFDQSPGIVQAWGSSTVAGSAYARVAGLPLQRRPWSPGSAAAWTTAALRGAASLVVDLPPGPLAAAQARRQEAAVLAATAAVAGRAPANRVRPRVVGSPRVGASLRGTHGTWRPSHYLVYRYRWLRCTSRGDRCAQIRSAAGPRYTPQDGDVGATLRVRVTAANGAGSASATSSPTGVVEESGDGRVVAFWHMDETSDTIMHDSADGHDGTLNAVAVGQPGSAGMAFGFNGRTSYVSVPSSDDLNPGTANITLTIHLRTTSSPPPPPGDADLIRKGTYAPTTSEYKVELQHSGQASCGFEGSAGYSELIAGPPVDDGQWHTIQCVKATTAIQLIVDGRVFTQPANVGSISNDAPVVIGSRPGSDWYAGELDEASIQIG